MARRKVTVDVLTSKQEKGHSDFASTKVLHRVVISNTTPLINFAEIGRMDLLQQLCLVKS